MRSATLSVVTLVATEGMSGRIDASTTRNAWTPRTLPQASTTTVGSESAPIGTVDVGNGPSETSSGWRLTENRAMLSRNEGSFQAHWLDGCRFISVAGSARGRDLDIAAANKRSAADCS